MLKVKLNFSPEKSFEVGVLAIKDRDIFFEYNRDFLSKGINISPFKLSLESTLQISKDKFFADGLFGVFNDSLPVSS